MGRTRTEAMENVRGIRPRHLREAADAAAAADLAAGLLRQPEPLTPTGVAQREGWIDKSTQLPSPAAFKRVGEQVFAAVQGRGVPLSMALLDVPDLPRVHSYHGAEARAAMLKLIGVRLAAVCGDDGLAARVTVNAFALLLPGRGLQSALDLLGARLGRGAAFELAWGGDQIVLLPSVWATEAGPEDATVLGLYDRCRRELDGGHRLAVRAPGARHGAPAAGPVIPESGLPVSLPLRRPSVG